MEQIDERADERIQLERSEHAALCYHVLAHLDLGRDAASIYDRARPQRPWVAALRTAYARAPGRLRLQFMGVEATSRAELEGWLRGPGLDPALRDAPGQALAEAFLRALAQERPRVAVGGALERERERELLGAITRLRAVLWETTTGPPPLTIVDCPALGWCGRASHRGRGGAAPRRVVGVSLARPAEHVILQVFHEETHRVTDPLVLRGRSHGARDTRVGQPGHALHEELERAAVEAGQAIIDVRAPELRAAYHRWRARFGVA